MQFDGSCRAEVSANGKSCIANLMISNADMLPIIGCDLINALELGVQGSSTVLGVRRDTQPESCTTSHNLAVEGAQSAGYMPLLWEFPALTLDTLGVFPDYQHWIELKPGAVPAACHPRPVPLVLHEGVEKAVCELDWNGIWEPVEKSEWVLHLVTPVKPMGNYASPQTLHP